MKIYVAGKVKKDSSFGTHHWRDAFVEELARLSGVQLENIDPLKEESSEDSPQEIFEKDCRLIQTCDVFVVYLSDDISVGGSQEILIARYFKKPVIGLAPRGGKFNGATREMFGKTITDYKDPFVFTTCDIVCGNLEEVAEALKQPLPVSTGFAIIPE
jgi:hypothetical protein